MRRYLKVVLAICVGVCSLGAGRAFYSSIEGMLTPGVIRAYPAVVDELYDDGTLSVRMLVWSGSEITVRVRITGISPTDINNYLRVISSKVVNQSGVFIQTVEQFDQSGVLFGTIFYSTQNGYRDVAMDLIDSRCAVSSNVQAIRPITQFGGRDNYHQEDPRGNSQQFRSTPACGSGKIDGKRIALSILSNILNK